MLRARRLDAVDPIERDLLPEGDVPEFAVDGVRRCRDSLMRQIVTDAFENVGGRRGGTVSGDGALELVGEYLLFCGHAVDARGGFRWKSSVGAGTTLER